MLSCVFKRAVVQHIFKNNVYRGISTTQQLSSPEDYARPIETREIIKDRTQEVPVETSIKYLESSAYKHTYGDRPVWSQYRRNHKGALPPRKTRRTCIRGGHIDTGSPCPICRDEYLVLNEVNIKLLQQFICPHTGSTLSYSKTGLCQKKHKELLVAIERAKDRGFITFDVPFRNMNITFVIVGGGISGVTCAETLAFLEPDQSILLISESSLIKTVTNLHAITRTLSNFDIEEKTIQSFCDSHKNVTVIHDRLVEINPTENVLTTSTGKKIVYQFLCLCTGAQPNIIQQALNNSYVLGIRDTDSVEVFTNKLRKAKKIVVVGNGGIASEVIHKIQNTDVDWVIKDKHITATFIDPGAAEFFQSSLSACEGGTGMPSKRMRYKEDDFKKSGAALGPDWYTNLEISGSSSSRNIEIHYSCEIKSVSINKNEAEFPILVLLSNDKKIECDLIVSATGVVPEINFALTTDLLKQSSDGGLCVNEFMQTSIANIYAAGDVCIPTWDFAKHWFPMKLWTQARQMGCYMAKCVSASLRNETILPDFCFELFAHSTKLFGYKVILLGLYNGQKLGQDYEILLRMTKGHEYIKFVLQNNKLQGAILIGETDLEETCENLILNQIDLSPYGDDILDPNIDIEDYFD